MPHARPPLQPLQLLAGAKRPQREMIAYWPITSFVAMSAMLRRSCTLPAAPGAQQLLQELDSAFVPLGGEDVSRFEAWLATRQQRHNGSGSGAEAPTPSEGGDDALGALQLSACLPRNQAAIRALTAALQLSRQFVVRQGDVAFNFIGDGGGFNSEVRLTAVGQARYTERLRNAHQEPCTSQAIAEPGHGQRPARHTCGITTHGKRATAARMTCTWVAGPAWLTWQ
jgi:hypothetical protein